MSTRVACLRRHRRPGYGPVTTPDSGGSLSLSATRAGETGEWSVELDLLAAVGGETARVECERDFESAEFSLLAAVGGETARVKCERDCESGGVRSVERLRSDLRSL